MEEKFIQYIEGLLNAQEKEDLEKRLEESSDLKKSYQEFLVLYNALSALKVEERKAPESLSNNVMAKVRKLKPLFTWSSIMSKGKIFWLIVLLCLPLLLSDLFREHLVNRTGVVLMLCSGLAALIYVFLPKKNFNSKWYTVTTCTACCLLCIFYRQSVGTFFPNSLEAVHEEISVDTASEEPQIAKTKESSNKFDYNYDQKSQMEIALSQVEPYAAKEKGSGELMQAFSNRINEPEKMDKTREMQKKGPMVLYDSRIRKPNIMERIAEKLSDIENAQKNVGGHAEEIKVLYDIEPPQQNTEEYLTTVEQGFLSPLKEAYSTFSIDVDTASYSNIRRALNNNRLPYKDAVRIEELINYFSYDLAKPEDKEVPFAVTTELSSAPWNSDHQILRIGVKGYEEKLENLPPSNLVFLIDVSGSMYSPDRLPLIKQGLKLLVNKLRSEDKISIVTYANGTKVVLDSVSGKDKTTINDAINSLTAGGGTYGESGINLAYEIASKNFIKDGNNRIILTTDGDFNVGISSTSGLESLIEKKRETGVFLSVFGFGMGNYKDNRLETLADKGNGNYGYIDSILEFKKTLLDGITGTLFTIAKDVKIQVEFNPAYVQAYRLVGYETRKLQAEDFNNDKKDAGELGVGHAVTALYEIVPVGVPYQGKIDDLKYQENKKVNAGVKNNELATVKLRYKLPNEDKSKLIEKVVASDSLGSGTQDQNFAAAVASFGMLLRDSEYKGDATYRSIIELAKQNLGEDENGDRHEFVKLAEKAELLNN